MKKRIILTAHAEADLSQLFEYISKNDSDAHAFHVVDAIVNRLNQLAAFPESGVVPKELLNLGASGLREIYFKPYRIIYRVEKAAIYIFIIADGRRDMQTLLQQRLLRIT